MNLIEAAILGVVQGITEFLPISSSGHLELGKAILGTNFEDNLLFNLIVHLATVLSIIIVFRKDIFEIFNKSVFEKDKKTLKYVGFILVSAIPVLILRVFFGDEIENLFDGDLRIVGFSLLITAALLTFTVFKNNPKGELSFLKSFLIGIAQAFAVLPGVSRSGSTISAALLLGVKKEEASRFSFLILLIPVLGGSFLEILNIIDTGMQNSNLSILIIGFITSFISGLFAAKFMLEIVKKQKLHYFAVYCLVVGILALILG